MPNFRVRFHYKRTVTAYIKAEDESDIDDFMSDNPAFNLVEDCPEMIEEDETEFDAESEVGDYEVIEDPEVDAGFTITPGLQIVENEDF